MILTNKPLALVLWRGLKTLAIAVIFLVLAGCKALPGLTFTGYNLDPKVKTFSVDNFFVDSSDGPADLGISFSEALREYFQRNTPLEQLPGNGDLQFSGSVKQYRLSPVAAGSSQVGADRLSQQGAQLQRLTIGVSVDYINIYDEEKSFEDRSFSFFSDFGADQTLSQVESQLIEEIYEQIVFDIFNATVADW